MVTANIPLSAKPAAARAPRKPAGHLSSELDLDTPGTAAPSTAGALLDYLTEHCAGVPLLAPERRAALRAGRGRTSNRRS